MSAVTYMRGATATAVARRALYAATRKDILVRLLEALRQSREHEARRIIGRYAYLACNANGVKNGEDKS